MIRTLRLPASMDDALRRIADERNSSVNALAEASLTRLIEFDQYADELEFVSVRKAFLAKGVEYLSDEEVRDFGKWTAMESGAEMLQFFRGDANIDSIIRIFETIIARYGKLFTFHHEVKGREHTITLAHKMGRKWSIFFDSNLRAVFSRVGISLKTEVSANFVRGRYVEES